MTPNGSTSTQSLPPLIPRKVLFGNPDKVSPRISPDGKRLAYLAPDAGVLNIWVRTLGLDDDVAITNDRKRGIRSFFWQESSAQVLYIQDQDGDENWHLYQTDIETRTTRDLTPFENIQARIVAADPNFPDQLLVGLNVRNPQLHDVYRLNLTDGTLTVDTENPGDVAGWTADNDLQVRIASILLGDGGTEIRLRKDADSAWEVFTRWGADETFGGVAGFTPDNQGMWLISSVDANASRLLQVDLATGNREVIAEDPQYDVSSVLSHPKTRALEAVEFTRARSEWTFLDPQVQADFEHLRPLRDGDINIVSRSREDTVWIVAYLVDDGPIYYYTYDRVHKKAAVLFSNRQELEHYQLAKMQPVSYTARDGMTIHGYLTLPPGKEARNLPMVLDVHGGPWARDRWGYSSEVQWLANRGYAVLQINFRGSTGYGKAYLNAGDREWGGRMHDDLIDGKRWAIETGYADPEQVAIYGGSYGGYAALVGLAFTPDEFACGVDIVGPSNIVTLIRSIPPYWVPIKASFDKRVGNLETEEDFLKSRSPLYQADQIKKPLLIAQGANDPRVKQAESDQIVEAMRTNGQVVEYLVFPDEGHGFARPENRFKFYAAAEQFLAEYLGGRIELPSAEEEASAISH